MNDQRRTLTHSHEFPQCATLRNLTINEQLKHLPNVFDNSAQFLVNFINDNQNLLTLISEFPFLEKINLKSTGSSVVDLHRLLIDYLDEQKCKLTIHSNKKDKFFRESNTKEVEFLQSVPINLHSYETQTSNLCAQTFTGGAICFHQNLYLSPNFELHQMLSLLDHLMFVMKTRLFVAEYLKKHQITSEYIPPESPRPHELLNVDVNDTIRQFYESTVELCLQITREHIKSSFVESAYDRIQKNLQTNGFQNLLDDQEYEPIDLTYLNVEACCVKMRELISSEKNPLLYSDIVSVNSKLLFALKSMEKTLLKAYSSFSFLNIKSEDFIVNVYRDYSLRIQGFHHLLFFAANLPCETVEQLCSTNVIPIMYESLLTSGGQEKRMLLDMVHALEWLEKNVQLQLGCDVKEPIFESFGPKFVVKVPRQTLDKVPSCDSSLSRNSKHKLVIFLFNMGVNSEENLAYLKNETTVQFDINDRMFSKLSQFRDRYHDENDGLNSLLAQIQHKIVSRTRKDVDFLVKMKDVCEKIGAISVTCCKSGKDRTSMSVTWEHARRQLKANDISDKNAEEIVLFSLRKYGVRIKNVVLNIGMNKYAFNPLQRVFLPKILQPPLECCLYGSSGDKLS